MSKKPQAEKCDQCNVIRNKLRCSLCKYATDEWRFSDDGAAIIGNHDMFEPKKEVNE